MNEDGSNLDMKRIANTLKMLPPTALPANFSDRVVHKALDQEPQKSWLDKLRQTWHAFFQPRQVTLRPAWQMAWVAMLCLVSAGATGWYMNHTATPTANQIWVRFAIKMPHAQQVALAGNFNAWETSNIQMADPDGDGIWDALVPLQPGVYQYMYVINGEEWVADPLMGETIDDGFGQQNSLIKINHKQTLKKRHRHAL